MIIELGPDEMDKAQEIPDPKHIWWDITHIVVYTGEDVPAEHVPEI